jgi:hypothetical protein
VAILVTSCVLIHHFYLVLLVWPHICLYHFTSRATPGLSWTKTGASGIAAVTWVSWLITQPPLPLFSSPFSVLRLMWAFQNAGISNHETLGTKMASLNFGEIMTSLTWLAGPPCVSWPVPAALPCSMSCLAVWAASHAGWLSGPQIHQAPFHSGLLHMMLSLANPIFPS